MTRPNPHAAELVERIRARRAVVGVIGLGYAGLPLADAFHEAGFPVLGFDSDAEKVRRLREGTSYLGAPAAPMTERLARSERFDATVDMARLEECDAIQICLPTPLGAHNEPELGPVTRAAVAIGSHLRAGQLVVLVSTTYPGTTRDIVLASATRAAEEASHKARFGHECFLAYAPEREDPGRTSHRTASTPKLVGGIDDTSTLVAAELYAAAIEHVIPVRSAEVAEASKLLENIFRSVNVALVNEMKVILTDMGIDVWEVLEAASTKPFGFMPFFPGPGLGGHCIPVDPFYFSWKAKELGHATRFIELAGEVNTSMPGWVVQRLASALNARRIAVNGARVLILGLAYKPDIADTRESPSLDLIGRLQALGASIQYHDPLIPETRGTRRHRVDLTSVPLSREVLEGVDAVLIATHHTAVDYGLVARHAPLVIDTRGVMRPFAQEMGGRLVPA